MADRDGLCDHLADRRPGMATRSSKTGCTASRAGTSPTVTSSTSRLPGNIRFGALVSVGWLA